MKADSYSREARSEGRVDEPFGDGEGGRRQCPSRKSRKKKSTKRVLALPDLEHAKTAVLNSLTSASGQRTSDHAIREFVAWYCSESRLAISRTVVLRYRIHLEHSGLRLPRSTFGSPRLVAWRARLQTPASCVRS